MSDAIELTTADAPLAFPVTLQQNARGRFTVTYGAQVKSGLTYAQAAAELGESILHALTCDSRISAAWSMTE